MPSGDNVRKLNMEIAKKIRKEYLESDVTKVALARRYGVNPKSIHQILINQSYKEVNK